MSSEVRINFASEGLVDAAVARRLIAYAGAQLGLERPAYGKHKLDRDIPKYFQAAMHSYPWLILRDLDNDAVCPAALISNFAVDQHEDCCFRIAVREIETWFIADRSGLAEFLRVPVGRIETDPETLIDPKRHIIDLARASRSRAIRDALVPAERTGQVQGAEYTPMLIDFASNGWSIERAIQGEASVSLTRASLRLGELVARQQRA